VTKCVPCPPLDPCERIVQAIAIEQEQLARILTSLANKAEKAANWLPDTAPDEPFNVIVDKVRALESVMAQEISALAWKEKAMPRSSEAMCRGPECGSKSMSVSLCAVSGLQDHENGVHGDVKWT